MHSPLDFPPLGGVLPLTFPSSLRPWEKQQEVEGRLGAELEVLVGSSALTLSSNDFGQVI